MAHTRMQPLRGEKPHLKPNTMVRLPKIKIGEGESERFLNVGSIHAISNVVKFHRKEKFRREPAEIVGIPTAWIHAVNLVELFSNPQDILVKQCRVQGSSQKIDLDAIRNLDYHARLTQMGFGMFRDPTSVIIGKTAKLRFRHDIDEGHTQITIEQLRKIFGIQYGVVEDGVIEFIHVKDTANNVNVLWQKFTRFKEYLTKIWDAYGKAINDLHFLNYGRLKKTSHLDVVAIHEDDDWFYNQNKVREAIINAYNPSFVKSKIGPMILETSARANILVRTESQPQPPAPTTIVKLFP